MRLVILDDYDKASEWAARYVKRRILDFNPGPDKHFTLGLPTGMCFTVLTKAAILAPYMLFFF